MLLLAWASVAAAQGARPKVLYFDPAGTPESHGIQPFRAAFERYVLRRHPGATFEHRVLDVDNPEAIAQAVRNERGQAFDLAFTMDTRIALAVSRELPGTPMVFMTLTDPVLLGVTDHPITPRSNVTGHTSNVAYELKHVEILQECVPGIRRIGIVADVFWAKSEIARRLLTESDALFGIAVELVPVGSPADVERLAQVAVSKKFDGWFVADTPFNRINTLDIARQLRASGKPSIAGHGSHARAGGLLSYLPERDDPWPRVGEMMNLVLAGLPAREIPFDRPKRFRLIVNRAAAGALGVQIPRSILKRANEFID